jgi:hypothetical protein
MPTFADLWLRVAGCRGGTCSARAFYGGIMACITWLALGQLHPAPPPHPTPPLSAELLGGRHAVLRPVGRPLWLRSHLAQVHVRGQRCGIQRGYHCIFGANGAQRGRSGARLGPYSAGGGAVLAAAPNDNWCGSRLYHYPLPSGQPRDCSSGLSIGDLFFLHSPLL